MKNRITDYEAGWLTLLIKMGLATEEEARQAMTRVAQAAVQELSRLARKKRKRQ